MHQLSTNYLLSTEDLYIAINASSCSKSWTQITDESECRYAATTLDKFPVNQDVTLVHTLDNTVPGGCIVNNGVIEFRSGINQESCSPTNLCICATSTITTTTGTNNIFFLLSWVFLIKFFEGRI